jgi:hypothetical protein
VKYLTLLLALALLGASNCGGEKTTINEAAQTHPVYESADLGTVQVLGAFIEASARFTLNADELLISVIVEGDYVPAAGNSAVANAELLLFDTRADQDPSNDLLAGVLPVGPFSRAQFSVDTPGSFSIRVPIAVAVRDSLSLTGGTWSARLRVQTAGWYGAVTSWRLRAVTLKGAHPTPAPGSFVVDP